MNDLIPTPRRLALIKDAASRRIAQGEGGHAWCDERAAAVRANRQPGSPGWRKLTAHIRGDLDAMIEHGWLTIDAQTGHYEPTQLGLTQRNPLHTRKAQRRAS